MDPTALREWFKGPKSCKVCGDHASWCSNHGLYACSGCKKFFSRYSDRYFECEPCRWNEQCTITKNTRALCKFCRLKKCFSVGMKQKSLCKEKDGLNTEEGLEMFPMPGTSGMQSACSSLYLSGGNVQIHTEENKLFRRSSTVGVTRANDDDPGLVICISDDENETQRMKDPRHSEGILKQREVLCTGEIRKENDDIRASETNNEDLGTDTPGALSSDKWHEMQVFWMSEKGGENTEIYTGQFQNETVKIHLPAIKDTRTVNDGLHSQENILVGVPREENEPINTGENQNENVRTYTYSYLAIPQTSMFNQNDPVIYASTNESGHPDKTQEKDDESYRKDALRLNDTITQIVKDYFQKNPFSGEVFTDNRFMDLIFCAHKETFDLTEENIDVVFHKLRTQPRFQMQPQQSGCLSFTDPPVFGRLDARDLQNYSNRFVPFFEKVRDFAFKIPCFWDLSERDKITLLKEGTFEVLVVRLSRTFDPQSNSFLSLSERVIGRDSVIEGSHGRFLLESFLEIAEKINDLGLSDDEVALFCALIMFSPRQGLECPELVNNARQKLEGFLEKLVIANHPERAAFADLMRISSALQSLNEIHGSRNIPHKANSADEKQKFTFELLDIDVSSNDGINDHMALLNETPPSYVPKDRIPSTSQQSGSDIVSIVTPDNTYNINLSSRDISTLYNCVLNHQPLPANILSMIMTPFGLSHNEQLLPADFQSSFDQKDIKNIVKAILNRSSTANSEGNSTSRLLRKTLRRILRKQDKRSAARAEPSQGNATNCPSNSDQQSAIAGHSRHSTNLPEQQRVADSGKESITDCITDASSEYPPLLSSEYSSLGHSMRENILNRPGHAEKDNEKKRSYSSRYPTSDSVSKRKPSSDYHLMHQPAQSNHPTTSGKGNKFATSSDRERGEEPTSFGIPETSVQDSNLTRFAGPRFVSRIEFEQAKLLTDFAYQSQMYPGLPRPTNTGNIPRENNLILNTVPGMHPPPTSCFTSSSHADTTEMVYSVASSRNNPIANLDDPSSSFIRPNLPPNIFLEEWGTTGSFRPPIVPIPLNFMNFPSGESSRSAPDPPQLNRPDTNDPVIEVRKGLSSFYPTHLLPSTSGRDDFLSDFNLISNRPSPETEKVADSDDDKTLDVENDSPPSGTIVRPRPSLHSAGVSMPLEGRHLNFGSVRPRTWSGPIVVNVDKISSDESTLDAMEVPPEDSSC